jgi:hypothetical protein
MSILEASGGVVYKRRMLIPNGPRGLAALRARVDADIEAAEARAADAAELRATEASSG